MKIRFLLLAFYLILAPRIISAQIERSIEDVPPEYPAGCTEAAESADYYFRYRQFCSVGRAESELKKAFAKCPEDPENARLRGNLTIVQEELASRIMIQALYYLHTYHTEARGLRGACARLKQIARDYPRFSATEQVLMLLDKNSDCEKMSRAEGETESDRLK